jgi:hypothetical protein
MELGAIALLQVNPYGSSLSITARAIYARKWQLLDSPRELPACSGASI